MLILWVLLGSVVGISAMVAVNAWLGLYTPAKLDSLDDAIARLDTDSVGFEAGEGEMAPDGRSALVSDATQPRLAMLVARGSDFVIRYLEPGIVKSVATEGSEIALKLNDFTFAPARLAFETPEQARKWAGRLETLQG
ncbi:hypothetical protein [Maricaulis parjimensis]|uniref:hypothetical protein n=1 Tax=Maricaulis parjimensis TaxID=144023 RepID=UPI0019393FB2|nr:hypothetical protein [Maricaulis parjimensis]